jgi:hypothetical protein
MLRINQYFCKHCSFHLQSEYVMVGHFWKPYICLGQEVGGELDLTVLIGGAGERVAIQIQCVTERWLILNIRST